MPVKLFNTLTRKKEEFEPIKGKEVGFYSCGPTVYWFQHIGNLRTYIFNDVLKRVLRYNGFNVKHVMNYTDVGHLTSDADEGEDKIEKAAAKEKKTAQEIADFYIKAFEKDAKKLNILYPEVICKATEYIQEQIDLVKLLEEKGFTYKTKDGIYFDTSKIDNYGELANINIEGLQEGKRVNMGGKKNKTDFALWKFSETPGMRQQEWDSPWGIGYPGWHTECCVMSSAHLGNQFDIHTGGEDHIQVHHTNEIAQMEAAYGVKPWVKYWMHGHFLMHKGEKVSKSKGGLFTIIELEEKGFEPMVYRYFCLGTHYKKPLNFSLEILENEKKSFERLKNIIISLKENDDSNPVENDYKKKFLDAVDDDLNTSGALAVLWEVLRDKELGSKEKLELVYDFDEVLGLSFKEMEEEKVSVSDDVQALVDEREEARKNKDFAKADKIRDELKEKGFELLDTPDGVKLRKA